MLGSSMRGEKGCSGGALRNADMLALQGHLDHSCASEGHLQQELDYVTPFIVLFELHELHILHLMQTWHRLQLQ